MMPRRAGHGELEPDQRAQDDLGAGPTTKISRTRGWRALLSEPHITQLLLRFSSTILIIIILDIAITIQHIRPRPTFLNTSSSASPPSSIPILILVGDALLEIIECRPPANIALLLLLLVVHCPAEAEACGEAARGCALLLLCLLLLLLLLLLLSRCPAEAEVRGRLFNSA